MLKIPLTVLATAIVAVAAFPALAAATDESFTTEAAQGGLAEVQLGQLAQSKAASQQVKQFGETLVRDHTEANQELQQIAQQENIALPGQPSQGQNSEKQKLQGLSGTEFDHQFVQGEIKDHQKDISLFEQEARSGKNGTLKSFAEKSLPVLRKHLQIAQSLASSSK
jgi:putative membrane protein